MGISQLKAGSLLSYVQMALGMAVGLAYTPVMIRLLGQSEYGLYNTVSSTMAMLSILSLGFNSGYIRYYSVHKEKGDGESLAKLNGLFLIVFAAMGTTALFCGLFIAGNLEYVFGSGLTSSESEIAVSLMVLLTVNLAASFPMSIFSSIISAHERFVFLKTLGIVKTVASPLVTIPLLLAGYRSVAMALVTVVVSLIVDACYLNYVLRVLKCRFAKPGSPRVIAPGLISYTVFIAINMIVDQVNTNLDKFILARYCGTGSVAIYSVGFALYQYYMMFSTAISSMFTPRIHAIAQRTKKDMNERRLLFTELFIKVGRIQFLILALVASGLAYFGRQFIVGYWAGPEYEESYYVMLLLVFSSSVALIQNVGIEIQRAQDKHRFRSICYLAMAFVNIAITVVICQKYGATGAALGTAFSLLLANGLIMNVYYHKRCNVDVIAFWKSILCLARGLIAPIALAFAFRDVIFSVSLVGCVLAAFVFVFVYCVSMWFVGMNPYEKQLVCRLFRNVGMGKLVERIDYGRN